MKIKKLCLILAGLGVVSMLSFAHANNSIAYKTTTWINEHQSELTLNFESNGKLSGTFTNHAKSACDNYQPHPVTGSWDESVVSFVVDFPTCHSQTAWNGHLSPNKNSIDSIWILSYMNSSNPDAWNTNLIGHDKFNRTS